MEDLDNLILKELQNKDMTINELRVKLDLPRPESRLDKRMVMLRKWGMVDYKIDRSIVTRGKKPLLYSLSKKANDILKK